MAKKRKKISVAVIFFGQPRFVENRLASYSHRLWLRGCDVEYFGHCWYSEGSVSYSHGENVSTAVNISNNAPRMLKQQYRNIRLQIDEPMDDVFSFQAKKYLEEREDHETIKNITKLPIFISQYYSIRESLKVFSETINRDYDFVVLSRYDNFIVRVPRPKSLAHEVIVVSDARKYFADLLFIGNKTLIDALNVFPYIADLVRTEDDFAPEEFKRAAFFKRFNESQIRQVHMNIRVLRETSILKNLKFVLGEVTRSLIYKAKNVNRVN